MEFQGSAVRENHPWESGIRRRYFDVFWVFTAATLVVHYTVYIDTYIYIIIYIYTDELACLED